jgi:hypothetical protein
MTQFGQQSPRYSYLSNPYERERITACPRCNAALSDIEVAVLILVEPNSPLMLRLPSRHCAACDLLLIQEDDLERGIEDSFRPTEPELIGNKYQVLGTIDLADWERAHTQRLSQDEIIACLHDFRQRLAFQQAPPPAPPPTPPKRAGHSLTVPRAMQNTYDALVKQTDAFCRQHLNDEYAQLAREMTAALCRKRPSPLASGKPATWACAILYALGQINFLFDRTQTPHLTSKELCAGFGVSASTASAKAKQIRDALHIDMFDARWMLAHLVAESPLA